MRSEKLKICIKNGDAPQAPNVIKRSRAKLCSSTDIESIESRNGDSSRMFHAGEITFGLNPKEFYFRYTEDIPSFNEFREKLNTFYAKFHESLTLNPRLFQTKKSPECNIVVVKDDIFSRGVWLQNNRVITKNIN